jgi:hypothetical protein
MSLEVSLLTEDGEPALVGDKPVTKGALRYETWAGVLLTAM